MGPLVHVHFPGSREQEGVVVVACVDLPGLCELTGDVLGSDKYLPGCRGSIHQSWYQNHKGSSNRIGLKGCQTHYIASMPVTRMIQSYLIRSVSRGAPTEAPSLRCFG